MPQRYRMEAGKCRKCGKIFFPPRLVCNNCGHREFETVKLSDEGKVVSFTVTRVAPQPFLLQQPYVNAIIELADGVRLTTQVVDCLPEEVAIGKPVRIVFRKVQEEGKSGILCYGYKVVLT
jgi:uncharacterized OB-fold protein